MSRVCEICGKKTWFGMQVSHSHRRTPRRWLPNLQKIRVKTPHGVKRMRVCTSCISAGKVQKP